ncbi:hypothetical protein D3C71_512050 [compost metagenome]
MIINKLIENWKYPSILLFGIGVTNIAVYGLPRCLSSDIILISVLLQFSSIFLLRITLCLCVMQPSKTNFVQLTSPSKEE